MGLPPLLRSRLALGVLLGVFLIPIGLSSLRGLTHVLICSESVETPFTVILEDDATIVLSSTRVVAGQEAFLCGGLRVDIQADTLTDNRVELTFTLTNRSESLWRGTVSVDLNAPGLVSDSTVIPVAIGPVPAGEHVTETVVFTLPSGRHEFSGSLLVGP